MSVGDPASMQRQADAGTPGTGMTPLKELEAVRSSLAAEVLTILDSSAVDAEERTPPAPPPPPPIQTLLCAAIADLQEIDDQLHRLRILAGTDNPPDTP
ncbi:hypothetical protein [uncultured Arthrobacter sp.]|uniref:hypothetical protein n=1 Tax=uncultured Arthrobacter sp. TaxID=114050 RepID=UPI0025FE22FA|nr:hypothetical protein [uncultured Arthrobacter sp.]